jgi:hypothetical protein
MCYNTKKYTTMDLQLIGGILGLLIHIPLLHGIWSEKVKQSFATYGLWSILDLIAAYSIYSQNGNFWLPLLYGIGAGLASISLLFKKSFSWGWIEWLVLTLVFLCILIQYQSGSFYSMIASVASLSIASIPQIIDTYKNPKNTPTIIYSIFCLANLLSLLGANSFKLEQILYASSALILCSIITILSMRKELKNESSFWTEGQL